MYEGSSCTELTYESGVSGLSTNSTYFSSNHYFQTCVKPPFGHILVPKIQSERQVSMCLVSLKLILLAVLPSPGLVGRFELRERASLARCHLPLCGGAQTRCLAGMYGHLSREWSYRPLPTCAQLFLQSPTQSPALLVGVHSRAKASMLKGTVTALESPAALPTSLGLPGASLLVAGS